MKDNTVFVALMVAVFLMLLATAVTAIALESKNDSLREYESYYFLNERTAIVSQWNEQDFVAANLRDTIGTLFCADGSRLPCCPTYEIETRIVGWKLMVVQYERSYDYMTAWIPVYQSRWVERRTNDE